MTASWAVTSLLLLVTLHTSSAANRPHIVFIVADDLGWNDIGWHNPDIHTPAIDSLARAGVILNQSYVQPLCSPSRSAFMSGYYPFHTGLQHLVILNQQPVCLPTNLTLLPQHLKQLGYATHMVGKWHLGFCNWNCTPTYRGFDSFYGYYNAQEDYYTHQTAGFLDLHDGEKPVENVGGWYSTLLFQNRIANLIFGHNASEPLFLYLPFQNVHQPIEVPWEYSNMYPNITDKGRKTFSGMVSALDCAVSNITLWLKTNNMLDDTLFIFTADNGGWVTEDGNNFPLRGGKFTIYEGGTRAVAFVSGKGLSKTGYTFEGLMHAVDWLPTIVAAAGGEPDVTGLDGMNLWPAISQGGPSPRTEVVYNIDDHFPPEEGHAAIRMGDYKLIQGFPGLFPGWYEPATTGSRAPINTTQVTKENWREWLEVVQLFNVKEDPTEHNDLSSKLPDVVAKLKARLEEYRKTAVPANYPPLPDPNSNPTRYGNVWSPGWC